MPQYFIQAELYFLQQYQLHLTCLQLNLRNKQSHMNRAQLEPFYFQCIPRNLICMSSPPKQGQFKFYVYKDSQKYDASKVWHPSQFQNKKMVISNSKLQFFIHSFIQKHNVRFTLKLVYSYPQEAIVGKWDFFVNDYIIQYKRTGQNRFVQNIQLSQQYSLDFQLFLQISKFHLQKTVKSCKDTPIDMFEKVKPNSVLAQSIVKEEEQIQIYSKEQQQAKLQQFRIQEQLQRKDKQKQVKKIKLQNDKQQLQRKNIQFQKQKSKQIFKIQKLLNAKWLILALFMVVVCIYILGSNYLSSYRILIQDNIKEIPIKSKNKDKSNNKKKK